MASFLYIYRTSDGERHAGEIDTTSREEAFAILRKRGIRPIKVTAKDGSKANGEVRGVRKRIVAAFALSAAILAGGLSFWIGREGVEPKSESLTVQTPDGSITLEAVKPMVRRQVFGDHAWVLKNATNLFQNAAEQFLVRYAEPGSSIPEAFAPPPPKVFEEVLAKPIYILPNERTEAIELKSMVLGMKEEIKMFLSSGGTIPEYLTRLTARQKMEADYRLKAARDVESARLESSTNVLLRVWQKSNAWLKTMGIKPLPTPPELVSTIQ